MGMRGLFGLAALLAATSTPLAAQPYWSGFGWGLQKVGAGCTLSRAEPQVGEFHLHVDAKDQRATVYFLTNRPPVTDANGKASIKIYLRDDTISLTDWGGILPFDYEQVADGRSFFRYRPSSHYRAVLNTLVRNTVLIFMNEEDVLVGVFPLPNALRAVEQLYACAAEQTRPEPTNDATDAKAGAAAQAQAQAQA